MFVRIFFILVIGLFALISCAVKDEQVTFSSLFAERFKKILVLPFDVYCPTESPLPFHCPVSGVIPGEIEPYAKETLDRLLRHELSRYQGRFDFVFLSQENYELLLEEALSVAKDHVSVIRYFANRTETQGIFYGKIFRFRERKGRAIGVHEPASVAFTLILYDGNSGKILWQRTFDETQRPLSENILNLPLYGKIKWLTAEELAERGLKSILKSF